MENGKPSAALILGGVDLILVGGLTLYTTSKISAINTRIDKLEGGKAVKTDGEFIDSINDIYDRVEFLENENDKLKDEISRLGHITNKLLFALNSNNIQVDIDQSTRRVLRTRKPSKSRNSSSRSTPRKAPKEEDDDDYPRAKSVSSHDDDDDVLQAVAEAGK